MASVLGGGSEKKGQSNDTSIKNATTRIKAAGKSNSVLGESYANTGSQSVKDQLLSKLSPLLDPAGAALNVVQRPSQGILHALQQFSGTKGHITPEVVGNAAEAFGKGFKDTKGEDNLNLRATLNQDPNAGGRLAGLFDTLGTVAIDPTTYLTGGTKAVGTVGLKIIESQMGKEVAEQVSKKGIGSLDTAQQAAVKKAVLESEQGAAKKGGPEKLLADITGEGKFKSGALEGGKGIKFAGKTVLKYDTLAPAARAAKLPEIGDAIKGTQAAKTLSSALNTGTDLANVVGDSAATKALSVIGRGRAAADNASVDVNTQIRSALKESGKSENDLRALSGFIENRLPTDALDPKSRALVSKVNEIVDSARATKQEAQGTNEILDSGKTILDQSLRAAPSERTPLETLRGQFKGKNTEDGYLDQKVLEGNEAAKAAPLRVLTPKAVKAINKDQTKIARALGLDVSASPGAIAKHLQDILPESGVQDANERLTKVFNDAGIKTKDVFKTNTLEAAADTAVQANREAAMAETLKGLSEITDDFGDKILILGSDDAAVAEAKRLGYQESNTVLGRAYVPKELVKELDNTAATLTDDHALRELGTIMDKWGKLWRGYATVPTLFGVGFHERNFAGNVFNMWLGGFRDPALFRKTDKILRAIESGTNKGATADAAIDAAKSLSEQERMWIRLARKEGVIGDSFYRTDQAAEPKVGQSLKQKLASNANPLDLNNPILRSGGYVGRRIEDNSRLAMFIDQMQKHGDAEVAATQVKKHLFDYSDLTGTEKALKKVIPFYTYMRKNTPLQAQAFLQSPGKFSAVGHARDNAIAGASDSNGEPIPQYALQNGAIPIMGGDTPIVGSFDLPYAAAAKQVSPLLMALSQLGPEATRSEGGMGKALREGLSNFGGGPIDVAKLAVEEGTGTSLLTGNDLKPGTGKSRAAKALVPLFGKGESTIGDLASDEPAERKARLISAITGVSATPLTENVTEGEKARRAKILQALAKDTATIDDLEKAGKIPKAKKAKTAKAKKAKVTKAKTPPKGRAGSKLPKAKKPKTS